MRALSRTPKFSQTEKSAPTDVGAQRAQLDCRDAITYVKIPFKGHKQKHASRHLGHTHLQNKLYLITSHFNCNTKYDTCQQFVNKYLTIVYLISSTREVNGKIRRTAYGSKTQIPATRQSGCFFPFAALDIRAFMTCT